MDHRVGALLNGRGHRTVYASAIGLANASDEDLSSTPSRVGLSW